MKMGTQTRGNTVAGHNADTCKKDLGPKSKDLDAVGLWLLIADMMDMIAEGAQMYMIIGATKDHSAFSVTIKGDQAPDPIYASSLAELQVKAADLL